MKKRIACLIFAAVSTGAAAQYVGPSERPTAKVADILSNPVDDQRVELQGRLLRKIGDEKYIFSDGTGEIVAEIDDDEFRGQRVDESTRVKVQGEVDTGRKRPPEIEVDRLTVMR